MQSPPERRLSLPFFSLGISASEVENLSLLEYLAGDPDSIVKVPGRVDVSYLDTLTDKQKENLELLNLK